MVVVASVNMWETLRSGRTADYGVIPVRTGVPPGGRLLGCRNCSTSLPWIACVAAEAGNLAGQDALTRAW